MSPGGSSPTIGRIVIYTHPHGALAPAVVCGGEYATDSGPVCDLHVLGANAGFIPGVLMDGGDVDAPAPGTWRWPERV